MSIDAKISRNLSEPSVSLNGALRGVPASGSETPFHIGDIYYRYADDPTAEPQLLGPAIAGHSLAVPIDLAGRSIYINVIGKTSFGNNATTRRVSEGTQVLFTPPSPPLIYDITYDDGIPEVDFQITGNGGMGDIHIFRDIDGGGFGEIDSVAFDYHTGSDMPSVNGTYSYKAIQDGVDGESNVLTIAVTGIGSGTGSPPNTLGGTYDSVDTVSLSWTNHGGTGSVIVERRLNDDGSWSMLTSLSSSATSYDDVLFPDYHNRVYYYRVRNTSVDGYSNEIHVYIAKSS